MFLLFLFLFLLALPSVQGESILLLEACERSEGKGGRGRIGVVREVCVEGKGEFGSRVSEGILKGVKGVD